jgi:hypothetical protein
VNAEFNWWLLIVGLVIGAGLTWLVLSDSSRREVDIEERELDSEARWIAETLAASGGRIDDDRVLDVLHLHRAYLAAPPPDEVDADDDDLRDAWTESDSLESPHLETRAEGPMTRPLEDSRRPDHGRVEQRARLH